MLDLMHRVTGAALVCLFSLAPAAARPVPAEIVGPVQPEGFPPADLAIVSVSWRQAAQFGFGVQAFAVTFSQPIADPGAELWYNHFGVRLSNGQFANMNLCCPVVDPGDPNTVLLSVSLFCCQDNSVFADGRNSQGLAFTWNYSSVFVPPISPQSTLGSVPTVPPAVPFTIQDRIAPSNAFGTSFHDTNADGRLDAVGFVFDEPVTSSAVPSTFALRRTSATVYPIGRLTADGVLNSANAVADANPANNVILVSQVATGDAPTGFYGHPQRLGVGNAVLVHYNPNFVNWDNNPATPIGSAQEAIPGTSGPAAVTIESVPGFTVADASGNLTHVFSFGPIQPAADFAPPVIAFVNFLTGDNIADGLSTQRFFEQDNNDGDQLWNNRLVFIASESLNLFDFDASRVRFGPSGEHAFSSYDPVDVEFNQLAMHNNQNNPALIPGVSARFLPGSGIVDSRGNEARLFLTASVNRTAPYAPIRYYIEPQAFAHAQLVDLDFDGFADQVRIPTTENVLPSSVQASDFSVELGTITSAGVSGGEIVLTLTDGVVPMAAPLLVTHNGAADAMRITGQLSGNTVSAVNSIAFAVGTGTQCPLSLHLGGVETGNLGDCNNNGIPDGCDILSGVSEDWNYDEIPDECQAELRFSDDCHDHPYDDREVFPTIQEALSTAVDQQWCNLRLTAAEPRFQNISILLGGQPVDFTSRGGISISNTRVYTLNHGSSLATADGGTISVHGSLRAEAGATIDLNASTLSLGLNGTLTAFQNSTVRASTNGISGAGTLRLLSGATFDATGTINLQPSSTLSMQSGSTFLSNASITLGGSSNASFASLYADSLGFSGGSHVVLDSLIGTGPITIDSTAVMNRCAVAGTTTTINGPGRLTFAGDLYSNLTNSGRVYTVGTSLIVGSLTNNPGGIITIQIGVTTLIGSLTNNGTIVGVIQNPARPASESDLPPEEIAALGYTQPGDGLSIQGDLTIGADASLIMPHPIWRLSVAGNFDCAINDNTRFDLSQAELAFSLAPSGQSIEAMSIDRGVSLAAYQVGSGNYPIGTLRLGPGAMTLTIINNRNNTGAPADHCEAVYVRNLIIEPGAVLNAPGCRVYYQNLMNNGTIATPANVVRVPVQCPGDANNDGFVNFADISSVLTFWAFTYPDSTGPGDANHDGIVNFADITAVLTNFGLPCP